MRKRNNRTFALLLVAITCFLQLRAANDDGQELLQLWYDHPAQSWSSALPLGNGRIGAMVFGNPENEGHISVPQLEGHYACGVPMLSHSPLTN